MKIGKLEKSLMIGFEDSLKMGASVVKNLGIFGFEICKYAVRNSGRVIKEIYPPAEEIGKIVLKETYNLGKQGYISAADAGKRIKESCRQIWNDKSNLYKHRLNK